MRDKQIGDMGEQAPVTARTPAAVARIALAWIVGVSLIAWLTRGVEWRHLAAGMRGAPWWAWTTTLCALLASYVLRALRIHAELRARHSLTVPQCLEVMLLHNSAVNVLPMRGGEAAYPWLMKRRLGVPLDHATASLVWMRLQDAFVLAILALVAWPRVPLAVRAGGVTTLVVALAVGLALLRRFADALGPARGPRLLRVVHRAAQALALAPRHGWRGWLYCASSWTVKLVGLGVLVSALSGIPLVAGGTGALGGELAGVLPVQGPANVGTYEAGVVLGASLRAEVPPELVASALTVHALVLATALLSGAAAYLSSQRRSATPRFTEGTS